MKILQYKASLKQDWDNFIVHSKNSHFMFFRDYMEYHKDRFDDFSLLIFNDENKLISLFPANIERKILYSHQGLTFGGFIINDNLRINQFLKIFETVLDFLVKKGINKIVYKTIPYIFHKTPAEEDRYALFLYKAKLIQRDVFSIINLKNMIKYSSLRKRMIKRAIKNKINITLTEDIKDFEAYWRILEEVLEKQHGVKPTHTLEEIVKLYTKFPNNIKLYIARKNDRILAGSLIYETDTVVHTQYLANSFEGREYGALDLVIDFIIKEYKGKKYYLSFGRSTEKKGLFLNEGLVFQKEGFGARTIVHDIYQLDL